LLDQTLAHKGLIYSKSFGVTMTMGHLAFIVLIALVAPQVDAWGTSSGALMRGLSAQSRKMDDWWAQFDQLWSAHKKLIAQNPNILCMVPDWEDVLDDLKTAEKKIILVEGGLIAMKEQLKQIRAILESADLGGKSGLHCEKTPTESICIALKALDMDADQKQIKLNREKSEVKLEIIRVETYNCNCKWEEWKGDFGACTPECGDGTHTETRKILWPHRNDGAKCKDSDATKTEYCTNGCCPVNCAWADWESWESCPKECKAGPNYRERVRKIERQGECISGGGIACVNSDANGKEECNIVAVLNGQIQDKKDKIKALKKLIETYKQKLCEPNPCMNGGVCFEGVCTCAKGWTGVHCKTDDLCTPNPCQNGGACKQGVCTCTGGWKGSRCTEKEDGGMLGTTGGQDEWDLRALFPVFDTNPKDERLSASELYLLIMFTGTPDQKAHSQEIFQNADGNNDGFLDVEEFADHIVRLLTHKVTDEPTGYGVPDSGLPSLPGLGLAAGLLSGF